VPKYLNHVVFLKVWVAD